MIRLLLASTMAICVLTLGMQPASAAKFNKKVNIGDKPTAWKELKGVDGKTHSLNDYKKADVLVIAFTCNHCPVANAYEARFNELAKRYKADKVHFVAISVSDSDVDNLDAMRKRSKAKGYEFDYLQDLSQESARNFGAMVTPHLYVLDKNRQISYMGAFDDSMNPAKVENHYVEDAVKALLAGKSPEVKESLQFGCGIQYKRK